MLASTLSSINTAQAGRLRSLPQQFATPVPAREVFLEGFRQRNAVLDAFFYDIGTLSEEEAASLAPTYAAEGAILAVGPTASPSLKVWPDFEAFDADDTEDSRAVAVAGVGSSALGAAAFARNVADATGGPVLTVVSGYGLADLLTEAVGGYFLFGYLNSIRHLFEPLDDLVRPQPSESLLAAIDAVRKSRDVRTLTALLGSGRSFDLLVGHSKGNLVISEALFAIEDDNKAELERIVADLHIVTISAVIKMPNACSRVTDVLGTLDGFGLANSRLSIKTDVPVWNAWHHTNTDIRLHLPVTETLTGILAKAA